MELDAKKVPIDNTHQICVQYEQFTHDECFSMSEENLEEISTYTA